jgi:sugar phosphate isomerase/epimerase
MVFSKMDKHWDHYCALSIIHFLAFPECLAGDGPILETVGRIADDDFFSAIEISRINDAQTRRQAAQLIEQSHMGVAFSTAPIILGGMLDLNSPDAAERQRAMDTLKPYIVQAAEVGAQQFTILSGPDTVPARRPSAALWLIESIRKLCAFGREHGVSINLETFDRTVDKKALIGPADEAAALAATIKADFPDFGILYDMGHMPLLDESPLPALTTLKDHLVHVHLGNCVKVPGRPAYGDLHPRFGLPGGENDVPQLVEFLRALFEVGYLHDSPSVRPGVGFEMRPQAGETSSTILANIKRTWREAWAQV